MTSWLSRIRSEPQSAPAIPNSLDASWLQAQTPSTPRSVPKPRDPNAPDYRYQVNQKCIYERRLPGGSYITAHVQRLQSGFYDSPVIHEDCIDNVRFVAINFVFHPSRSTFRFTNAQISIALHHTDEKSNGPLAIIIPPRSTSHDHGTQTETVTQALIRSQCLHGPAYKPSKPRFLRHAPHLLYGSISPETLNWNFNLAGSLGVSQGPANASLKPSYGVKSSYKVYDMMKIQGSVRTLRSWAGHDYDIEDGELIWTLEENKLQKSGLPREFTFVMLLTKGSGTFEESGDVRLEVDINPKIMGRLGTTYPAVITNLHQYRPFKNDVLDLDDQIGQVFEPQIKDRGFNFANIASNFDEFVWLPGNAFSTSEPSYATGAPGQPLQQVLPPSPVQQRNQPPQAQQPAQKPQQALPSGEQTLNLRVFLETGRGSPVPFANQLQQQLPYLNLRVPQNPSRTHSPLPPSIAGSKISTRRTITIGSGRSIRKKRSSSELGKQYSSSPAAARAALDPKASQVASTVRERSTASQPRPYSYQEVTHGPHDHATQMSPVVDRNNRTTAFPQNHADLTPQPHSSPEYITPPEQPQPQPPSSDYGSHADDYRSTPPTSRAENHRSSVVYDNPPMWDDSPSAEQPRTGLLSGVDNSVNRYSAIAAQRALSQRSREDQGLGRSASGSAARSVRYSHPAAKTGADGPRDRRTEKVEYEGPGKGFYTPSPVSDVVNRGRSLRHT
jgi:hypothetical protein